MSRILSTSSMMMCGALLWTGVASAQPKAPTPVPASTTKTPAAAAKTPAPAATDHHDASTIVLTPKEIKWVDAPPLLPPGAKIAVIHGDPKSAAYFMIRLKFPNGYKLPPHFHPVDENVTIIQGTFNLGMGDKLDPKATKAMTAGSYFSMPVGHHHYAVMKGETITQITTVGPWGLTYVNPADDPRNAAPAPAKGAAPAKAATPATPATPAAPAKAATPAAPAAPAKK